MRLNPSALWLGILIAGIPAAAMAHTGVGNSHGFAHGFAHPMLGLDHVLAMVAVGMYAAYLGGRALWLVPASFVAMMAFGGALGLAGAQVPMVEASIGASVVVLGLAVALQWTLPTVAAMGLVGFFAIFHGHAHGAEMPAAASGLMYALGFMMATALLHVGGIGLGLATGRMSSSRSRMAASIGGAVTAVAGVGLLAGVL